MEHIGRQSAGLSAYHVIPVSNYNTMWNQDANELFYTCTRTLSATWSAAPGTVKETFRYTAESMKRWSLTVSDEKKMYHY